jgi:hypothetical protein
MPNHIHGIIAITAPVGAQYLAPGPLPDSPDFIKIPDSINNNDVGAILPNDEVENETQNGVKNRAQDIAPLRGPSQTIGAIIRGYKIGVTKQIKQLSDTRCNPVWQRNYYEHIIRNMRAYENIARYIRNNPLRWQDDKYYGLNDRI